MPGLTVPPVMATRTGWASLPSFIPSASSTPSKAVLTPSGEKGSTPAMASRARASGPATSGFRNFPAAFSSNSTVGRKKNAAPLAISSNVFARVLSSSTTPRRASRESRPGSSPRALRRSSSRASSLTASPFIMCSWFVQSSFSGLKTAADRLRLSIEKFRMISSRVKIS